MVGSWTTKRPPRAENKSSTAVTFADDNRDAPLGNSGPNDSLVEALLVQCAAGALQERWDSIRTIEMCMQGHRAHISELGRSTGHALNMMKYLKEVMPWSKSELRASALY